MSPSAPTWAVVRASPPQLQQFPDADDKYLFRRHAYVTGALRMEELRFHLVTRPCDRPIRMPAPAEEWTDGQHSSATGS